ncbi:S1 family peptidase [Streptomyces olivoreticuli]|uniref:S1 family peptidase n=1 Tax=Streptomyces olivoreticuli TaxID=68246 RepID=UPI001F07AC32|nr:S1 family peptidase [Streptomyces olivoreticuli]
MKPSRIRARATLAAAAMTALAAVTLSPQTADASTTQAPRELSVSSAGQLARTLVDRLKGEEAGSYYDEGAHRLVVNVVSSAAEGLVRAVGAQPKVVKYSQAELDSAQAVLNAGEAIPGTTWVSDPRVNRVVVTADPTVMGEQLTRLNKTVKSLGDAVLVRRTAAKLTRYIAGGDGIYGAKYRCSLGFNVLDDKNNAFFLTAGHCGSVEPQWAASQGGLPWIGKTVSSKFPGEDHALVRYTAAVDHPGQVDLHLGGTQPIFQAADPAVGDKVTRSGSTTGVHSGKVTGLDATVNYAEGTVRGLIQTDVCAEGGDSGGPLFHDTTALGLTSGGSGDCMSGGTTFYEPVTRALAAYGVRIG